MDTTATLHTALVSDTLTQYKAQDDLRDPLDALKDAEFLLREARRIQELMLDPALRHLLAQRLEWVHRHATDPTLIPIAELLIAHNRDRCAKLGVLDVDSKERRSE